MLAETICIIDGTDCTINGYLIFRVLADHLTTSNQDSLTYFLFLGVERGFLLLGVERSFYY